MNTPHLPDADHQHAFTIIGLDHVALRVADMSKSVAWYQQVLGFEQRYADVWIAPSCLLQRKQELLFLMQIQQSFHQILHQRSGSVILQCV